MSDRGSTGLNPLLEAEELIQLGLEKCLGPPPYVLEIGFGRAELILDLAEKNPDRSFLGVEVSRKRVVKAGRRAEKRGIANVRLLNAPAEFVLDRVLPQASIHECWINCPDPWPKKRHYKRRLIQAPFVERLVHALAPGAILHLCTDHENYAGWIDDVLREQSGLENLHEPLPWSANRPERNPTAYELEWLAEGRVIVYFEYRRRA
ncbi:MAG: tRNA (guanosine(46)-N7)-methyltransferase TrmB [bacterium]|nr:tRNA (guanosine(46)-N7)-methyltransferase TrmB [bacterium]